MKYGILLLQDSVYQYKKDQIRLEDRILGNYDNMSSVRLSSIRGKNTNDLLQKVRSSHEKLYYWSKSLNDLPKYVYVMIGMDELKGGASHKWNNRHLESLILELSVYDFEIILFTSHVNKLIKPNQQSWLTQFKTRIRRLSKKYKLDIVIHNQYDIDLNKTEVEKIASRIALNTKRLYGESVIGDVSKKEVKSSVEVIEIKRSKKKSRNVTGIQRPRKKIVKKEVTQNVAPLEVQCKEPPTEPKKKGRKINNVGVTIDINSNKKNLASY